MRNNFLATPRGILLIYIVIEVFCTGAGMGVPIINILFGFASGYGIIKILSSRVNTLKALINNTLLWSIVASLVTFVLMAIIWLPWFIKSFSLGFNFENTGIPMILYDPRASFYGWIVLMVLISPFLQLLATIFTSFLTLKIVSVTSDRD